MATSAAAEGLPSIGSGSTLGTSAAYKVNACSGEAG
jgi:hypothetical protein